MPRTGLIGLMIAAAVIAAPLAQTPAPPTAKPAAAQAKVNALKQEAVADVEARSQFSQQMVDQIFSYGELGFQEFETNKYLIDILKRNGFAVEEGIAGIPTAFMATWGSGKPIIALGSDIDCIPQASQKPGVAWHEPMIEGAPGHGEGHNSGMPLNITAALAAKKIMEREHLPGTLRIWTGTAEELVGSKAHYIRAGLFKDVDVALFAHVSDSLDVSWGARDGTGLVSVQYSFQGETAHAAANPWRGRSALGAVELMDIGWNFRRDWANAIAMATPIAHKGVTAGAKVQAMTILDLVSRPELVEQAWQYFREVQTKDTKYEPLLRAEDQPAIWLNKGIMDKYRPEMKKYYYDPTRYKTYLEQLGITYPTVRGGGAQ
jgi:hypothetical protein